MSLIIVDVESPVLVDVDVVSLIIVDVESDTVVVDSVFVLEQAVASAIIERMKNADFAMLSLKLRLLVCLSYHP
ncbi:hypothetical protein Slin_2697 [Spirosoma linguale DSM 74]|uniref:Uncharacterized protein n=1 Tax=Spirosoma linguale (strain ATCC 33905 / DSM 74 / LMG 10896 / Claus 1) TaxID=504472 RepID=D2QIC9_SPILD|nr:hypothetical protein Slin_2697 [Spirosoma linguale DSM 74]